MVVLSVKIEPLEPMLFRDNRAARVGDDHVIVAHGPSPYTVFGAVGAKIASERGVAPDYSDWEKVQDLLGPFHADPLDGAGEAAELLGYAFYDKQGRLFYPLPAFFRVSKGGKNGFFPMAKFRIKPHAGFSSSPIPGCLCFEDDDEAEDEAEGTFAIGESLLEDLLCDREVDPDYPCEVAAIEAFYTEESRMGLGMDNSTNTAEDSKLFNRPYWRFHSDFSRDKKEIFSGGVHAWFSVLKPPEDMEQWGGVGFFGGDRGRARFQFSQDLGPSEKPLSGIMTEVEKASADSKGFFLYVLTPLHAMPSQDLYPAAGRTAVAAATGKPLHMSGWARARGEQHPRKMSRLVAPGSVFFYEWDGEGPEERKKIVRDHWFSSFDSQVRHFGFGITLTGVWS